MPARSPQRVSCTHDLRRPDRPLHRLRAGGAGSRASALAARSSGARNIPDEYTRQPVRSPDAIATPSAQCRSMCNLVRGAPAYGAPPISSVNAILSASSSGRYAPSAMISPLFSNIGPADLLALDDIDLQPRVHRHLDRRPRDLAIAHLPGGRSRCPRTPHHGPGAGWARPSEPARPQRRRRALRLASTPACPACRAASGGRCQCTPSSPRVGNIGG